MMKLTTLMDKLETVKEVLKENESAVTRELTEAIDYAIGLIAQMLQTEKITNSLMPHDDFMKQFLDDMSYLFGPERKRRRRK
tara:strand:+ start:482 stop:727 length:246 start_codon:yes stop_codon:yes gene_type:complete